MQYAKYKKINPKTRYYKSTLPDFPSWHHGNVGKIKAHKSRISNTSLLKCRRLMKVISTGDQGY